MPTVSQKHHDASLEAQSQKHLAIIELYSLLQGLHHGALQFQKDRTSVTDVKSRRENSINLHVAVEPEELFFGNGLALNLPLTS